MFASLEGYEGKPFPDDDIRISGIILYQIFPEFFHPALQVQPVHKCIQWKLFPRGHTFKKQKVTKVEGACNSKLPPWLKIMVKTFEASRSIFWYFSVCFSISASITQLARDMLDKKNKNLRGPVMRQTRRHPRDVDGKAFIFQRKRPQKTQLVSQKYGTQENRKRHHIPK